MSSRCGSASYIKIQVNWQIKKRKNQNWLDSNQCPCNFFLQENPQLTINLFIIPCFISAPSGSPRDITQTASSETNHTISWGEVPCGNRGGNITQYRYSQNSDMFGQTSDRSATISDLMPCSSYTFKVSAMNSAGRGPHGELIVHTLDAGEDYLWLNISKGTSCRKTGFIWFKSVTSIKIFDE